ncbi:MAG: FAD-dependent oxidoreductase [Prochloraceae cyanobacterium]|nr:FAD-dependent oxidoreductase [Prochloraceae cyanobacterium]
MNQKQVAIVGCGVSGLSCGIKFLEAGFQVKIVARDLPPNTTSNAAAAIWYPYKAYPEAKVLQWGRIALEEYDRLTSILESGVTNVTLIELFKDVACDPWWKDAVPNFRYALKAEIPPGYRSGYAILVPAIDTQIYMNYLLERFKLLGGAIESRTISSFFQLESESNLIINCAGLGAKEIASDSDLYPIRGQIIQVRGKNLNRSFIDQTSASVPTYIVPRTHDCILGGTAEDNNWSLTVNEDTANSILNRCQKLEPKLKDIEIVDRIVGLRPGRKEVRLELEPISANLMVIHNYGHGGAGFTLAWGCAEEVLQIALDRTSADKFSAKKL